MRAVLGKRTFSHESARAAAPSVLGLATPLHFITEYSKKGLFLWVLSINTILEIKDKDFLKVLLIH